MFDGKLSHMLDNLCFIKTIFENSYQLFFKTKILSNYQREHLVLASTQSWKAISNVNKLMLFNKDQLPHSCGSNIKTFGIYTKKIIIKKGEKEKN